MTIMDVTIAAAVLLVMAVLLICLRFFSKPKTKKVKTGVGKDNHSRFRVVKTLAPGLQFSRLGELITGADIFEEGENVGSLCEYRVNSEAERWLREDQPDGAAIIVPDNKKITVILRDCGMAFYKDFERACQNPFSLDNLA